MANDTQRRYESHFLQMLETFGCSLRRLCSAYRRDAAGREDLFQEIAVALWTALPRFRGDASERTWVYRIAHNVALTYSTKHRRQEQSERPMEMLPNDLTTEDDPQHLALLEAIHKLGTADRNLMILYLEGLSAREIEDVTGLTANNVAVRLTRLRHKLTLLLSTKEVRK